MNGTLGDGFDFLFEIGIEGSLQVGGSVGFCPKRKVTQNNGRKIAVIGIRVEVVDLGTAAEYHRLPRQYLRVRPVMAVYGEHILSALVVAIFECLFTHRYKLTSVGRGTG